MKLRNHSAVRSALIVGIFAASLSSLTAQSVSELRNKYSGNESWNASTGVLTFTSSGKIAFNKSNSQSMIWVVPAEVKEIVINANVQVTGTFAITNACTVRGINRDTSKLFGTDEQQWSQSRGLDGTLFSAIKVDDAVVTVKNLSMYRPFSYFIRGNSGSKITVDQVTLRDDRGGVRNNSDGFVGGDGSSVSNSLFATGDDAVKVYYGNTTYNNLTIEMEPNCVPIQIGWFAHGNVSATFNDLKVTGTSGRGSNQRFPVISGAGNYKTTATLTFNRPNINNPNASLFSLEGTSMTVNGSMTNAYVKVARYNDSRHVGKVGLTVCGSTAKLTLYDCR